MSHNHFPNLVSCVSASPILHRLSCTPTYCQTCPLPQPRRGRHLMFPTQPVTWHCYRKSSSRPLPSEQVKIPLTILEKPLPSPQVREGLRSRRQYFFLTRKAARGPEHGAVATLSPKYLWPGSRMPLLVTNQTLSFQQESAKCSFTPLGL